MVPGIKPVPNRAPRRWSTDESPAPIGYARVSTTSHRLVWTVTKSSPALSTIRRDRAEARVNPTTLTRGMSTPWIMTAARRLRSRCARPRVCRYTVNEESTPPENVDTDTGGSDVALALLLGDDADDRVAVPVVPHLLKALERVEQRGTHRRADDMHVVTPAHGERERGDDERIGTVDDRVARVLVDGVPDLVDLATGHHQRGGQVDAAAVAPHREDLELDAATRRRHARPNARGRRRAA